jgi:uncharacterized protein (UPF0147 family)
MYQKKNTSLSTKAKLLAEAAATAPAVETQPQTVQVSYGNIAEGYTAIASYLGMHPSSTVFLNSLITNPKDPVDFKMSDTDGLDWRSAQYVIPLTAPGSHAMTFEISPEQTEYLKKYVAKGDLQMVPSQGHAYPGGSIPAYLTEQVAEQSPVVDGLKGKTLFNSYQTMEVAHLSESLGHQPPVSTDDYLNFLSKGYVHAVAKDAQATIAPGIVLDKPLPVADYIAQIEKMGEDVPLNKIWIKASSLSGGQGIVPVENPTPESIKEAFNTIAKAYDNAGFFGKNAPKMDADKPFDGINFFMPIVVEADIGSLPGVKGVVANTCVQAVVTKDHITLVGTSLQLTKNGEYIGAALPNESEAAAVKAAESEAIKLLAKMSQDGYVGYAGVDVIVTKDDQGNLKPFALEVNPRLNASTPLLALAQNAEEQTGKKVYAVTVMHYLEDDHQDPNQAKVVHATIGKDLYKAEETGFEGVVPYMIDPNEPLKTAFRAAVMATSPEKLEALVDGLKEKVEKHNAFIKNVRMGL